MRSLIRNLLVIIGLILFTGCQGSIKPINVWNMNQRIISASVDESSNSIAVLLEDRVRLVSLSDANSIKEFLNLEIKHPHKIIMHKNYCWIGGGIHQAGFLMKLNTNDGSFLKQDKVNFSEVWTIALSNQSDFLATGHGDGEIILWNKDTMVKKDSFGDYDTEIFELLLSANNKKLFSGDGHEIIKQWDLAERKAMYSNSADIYTLAIESEKHQMIGGNGHGTLYFFNPDNLSIIKKVDLKKEAILDCDIQNTTGHIICGLTKGYIVLLNNDGVVLKTQKLHSDGIIFVKFIDNGEKMISASYDGSIKLWETNWLFSH